MQRKGLWRFCCSGVSDAPTASRSWVLPAASGVSLTASGVMQGIAGERWVKCRLA